MKQTEHALRSIYHASSDDLAAVHKALLIDGADGDHRKARLAELHDELERRFKLERRSVH